MATSALDLKQNDLSGGDFAGLVNGLIVTFLVLIALVVLCVRAYSGRRSDRSYSSVL